jgi:hypothetical protein
VKVRERKKRDNMRKTNNTPTVTVNTPKGAFCITCTRELGESGAVFAARDYFSERGRTCMELQQKGKKMRKESIDQQKAHTYAKKVWCGFLNLPSTTLDKADLRKLLDDSLVYRLSFESFLAGRGNGRTSKEKNWEDAYAYAFQRWADGLSPETVELNRKLNKEWLHKESRIYRLSLRGFLIARGERDAMYAPYG